MAVKQFNDVKDERCDPSDPNRCQWSTPRGQCPYLAAEGSKYCNAHTEGRNRKANLKNYRLSRHKARIEELGSSSNLKNLRDEIGILRITLEDLINSTEDVPLYMQAGPIAKLVGDISSTVQACHKLDIAIGSTLDKEQIMQVINQIIDILTEHDIDPDILEEIQDVLG